MKELSPPPLNLRRLYTETLEWEPVLIIISPGADPSQELAELAAETVGRDNYHEVEDNGYKWEKSQQIIKCKGMFPTEYQDQIHRVVYFASQRQRYKSYSVLY